MSSFSRNIKKLFSFDESVLLLSLIGIVIVLSFLSPYFMTGENIINVLRQSSITLIAGIGITVLLLVGEVDLSIGSLAAFVGIFTIKVLNSTKSTLIAVLVGLAIGFVVGIINSSIVTRFNINSLIVTLGMMSILRGTGYIVTNAVAVQNQVKEFTVIGTGYLGPIPLPVVIAFLLFALFYFILNYTTFGRYVYASGGNPKAAISSGINVRSIKTICFIICSMLAALSAVIMTARVNSGQPNLAMGFEMTVIAAAILGGTSLSGGQGSLLGTLIGILILGVLENGMVLLDVSTFYQDVVRGAVIIIAVILDTRRAAGKEKIQKIKNEPRLSSDKSSASEVK